MRRPRPPAPVQADLFGSASQTAPAGQRGVPPSRPDAASVKAATAAPVEQGSAGPGSRATAERAAAEPAGVATGASPPVADRAGSREAAVHAPAAAAPPDAPDRVPQGAGVRAAAEAELEARRAAAAADGLARPMVAEPGPQLLTAAAAARRVLTVGELTRQIKGTLERTFTRVIVRGEVGNYRGPNARGHLYFSLKDKEAQIDAKIWASMASRLKFRLREGLAVVIEGHVDLYEPQGRYSLIVQKIDPEGEGALALAFQQLKERLTAEGLMGDRRSRPPRPIPFLPRRIGVVTSKTGAALQDFLRVLHARHPRLSVLVADARVQGEGSAAEVVRALQRLARTDVDVIVVTRGGGSLEDLWTFNEEAVARAIFACPVPVVSAIGHEVDFTIADFVADLRAPTPSAAAERLAPVLVELELQLATWRGRLDKAMERRLLVDRGLLQLLRQKLLDPRRLLDGRRLHLSEQAEQLSDAMRRQLRAREARLRQQAERLSRQRPEARLQANRVALQQLKDRLRKAMAAQLAKRQERLRRARIAVERRNPTARLKHARGELSRLRAELEARMRTRTARELHALERAAQKLDALSPLKVMRRGYAVSFDADGHLLRRAADVRVGDEIRVRLLDPASPVGTTLGAADEITATVKATRPGDAPGV